MFFILLSLGKSKGGGGGGVTEPTLLLEMSRGSFPRGCGLPFRHHSSHGLRVGYSELMNGLIAAATGALVC